MTDLKEAIPCSSKTREMVNGTSNREHIVFTIKEFCAAYKISRAQFYILDKNQKTPRSYYLNKRRYITAQAASNWVQNLEQQYSIPTKGEDHV